MRKQKKNITRNIKNVVAIKPLESPLPTTKKCPNYRNKNQETEKETKNIVFFFWW